MSTRMREAAGDGSQLAFEFRAPLSSLPQLWTPDDIYDNLDEPTIIDFKEDSRLERKRVEVSQSDLADYLSMWANTQPSGGIVLIGIDNKGEIRGCAHCATEHLNEIESVRRLCPDAKHEFKRVPVKNAKGLEDFVIALRVRYREDKLVETVSGNAFIREGEDKRRLTEQEKREMRLDKGEIDVESERVLLKFPQDFDIDLLRSYRDFFISKRGLQPRYSLEDVLVLSKLGRRVGGLFSPNLACALLFANDARVIVPGAFIRVIRYNGVEEQFGHNLNMVADKLFDGPLCLQLGEADKFISSQIRNFTRLGRDGRFATNPEYPRAVWLEAVVNAVVHRSYNLKHMNIFVKMFEDKMIIESPGGFMSPTTADTVYDAHNPRNPNMMWAMYYFDFVQCAFEGTRRMRAGMREANLPDPKFSQKQLGTFQVSVTLQNDHEHRRQFVRTEASSAINPDVYSSLTESEKLIVNFLVDQDRVNVTEALLIVAKDWRATRKILDALVAKKVIGRSPGKARSRHRFYHLLRRATVQSGADLDRS